MSLIVAISQLSALLPYLNYPNIANKIIILITRIIKTFSIEMEEDVGMSKPKKHANKVG